MNPTTENPTNFADRPISDVLAELPTTCEWTIENSTLARIRLADGRRGRVFRDDQEPGNEGWAYWIVGSDTSPEESGPLNDADDMTIVFGESVWTLNIKDTHGKPVVVEVGDWLEIDSPHYGDYDRGEVISITARGVAEVTWQGAADQISETAVSLDTRVFVYSGKPDKWAHEWPTYDED